MAKAKKSKGFLAAAGSLLGSIPAVGSVKNAAKKVKQATKKTVQKVKKVAKVAKKAVKKTVNKKKKKLAASLKKAKKKVKKAKKKAKKKIGKVFTKARKLKNNLSPKQQIKKLKKNMKKAVLNGKKIAKKAKSAVKKASKTVAKATKKVMKKTVLLAKGLNAREVASAVVDFIPFIGNAKAAYESLVGKDPITGRKLEDWERVAAGAAIVGGAVVKGVVRGTKATLGIVSNVAGAGKKVTKPTKSIDELPKSKKTEKNSKAPEQVKVTTEVVSGVERVADKAQVTKGTVRDTLANKLNSKKLSSEKIKLGWLPDRYTAVEVKGTVKVAGKEVDVSRRVYQIEIDKTYLPKDASAHGLTNIELMAKGRSPYVVKEGVESKVELHHLIQKEPGGMVEIAESTHDKYSTTLHGLIENGNSFRNNPELEKQYNNFRNNYWKMRANER